MCFVMLCGMGLWIVNNLIVGFIGGMVLEVVVVVVNVVIIVCMVCDGCCVG